MKKVLFLLLLTIGVSVKPCMATDHNYVEQLLSLIKLAPGDGTQDKITAMLGKPARVEEGKKKTIWYYEHENGTISVSWDKKTALMDKFSFSDDATTGVKTVFDIRTSKRLQSGVTDVAGALKILGTPKDMTIKEMTQEMHYAYQNNVLRLFFRNKTLVDYTLY